ncbi:MAG TPA: hypothetical protein VGK48_18780 [Terriglobia bacterium]|jgi:hypothetical protein
METPEHLPIVIPPLTSRTDEGELYMRPEAVEAELLSVLPQGPAEWIKGRTKLKSESLVFLHRYLRRSKDDDAAGRLQQEINARTMRMGKRWIYGIDKEGTDFIVSEVEAEIDELLLAEIPSRQSEYLEVGFGQTVYRRTKDAVERFKNTPFAHKGNTVTETYDENGQEEVDLLEQVPDSGARPESEVLWADWVEKTLRFVTNPKHREAVILRYLRGWPITSKDPEESCLSRYFKVSSRQIQTWIDIALKQMKDGMMGEGYGTAKYRF